MTIFIRTVCALALVGSAAPAVAGELLESRAVDDSRALAVTGNAGQWLPLGSSAQAGGARAMGVAWAGYDSTRGSPVVEMTSEARLLRGLALRAGAMYAKAPDQLRPTVGLRLQVLRQGHHGVDGAVGLAYRPEGFTEAEGEVEGFLALGRTFGGTLAVVNVVYGQDPEGHERDSELRLALSRGEVFRYGVDGRVRVNLASKPGAVEPKLDAVAGPTASALVGPVVLVAFGGIAVLDRGDQTRAGAVVLGGVGTAF